MSAQHGWLRPTAGARNRIKAPVKIRKKNTTSESFLDPKFLFGEFSYPKILLFFVHCPFYTNNREATLFLKKKTLFVNACEITPLLLNLSSNVRNN